MSMEEFNKTLDGQGLSLLRQAEQRRRERSHSLFLDVPGWDGALVCEYRVVPPEELRKVAERATRRTRNGGPPEPAENDVAMIIAASAGLYVIDPDTQERVAVTDKYGHVGYDRIAAILGVDDEVNSVVKSVRYLMGERNEDGSWTDNVMALSLHAQAIGRWMKDPSKHGVDLEELLGEF